MRKKAKLITTIASLCLAVALMAFGVYAATSVTYNVNGTVKYELSDVLLDVTTNVYYLKNSHTAVAQTDVVEDGTDKITDTEVWSDGNEVDNFKTYDENYQEITENTNKTSDGVVYDFSESTLYKVVFSFTNHNPSGVKFSVTLPTVANDANFYFIAGQGTPTDEDPVAAGLQYTESEKDATTVFTYYIGIKDLTVNINNVPLNFTFSISE